MKTCTACHESKPLSDYRPRKLGLPGLHAWCRSCFNQKRREYRERVPRPSRAKFGPPKPKPPKSPRKPLTAEQKIRAAATKKAWGERNLERLNAKKAAYRAANREALNAKQKIYYEANRERYSANSLAAKKKRYKEDPLFVLEGLCRRRMLTALTRGGYKKDTKTSEMLGCSFEELKSHLESLFQPGMTWDNRGKFGWHIDHIRPLVSARDKEELESLCHFSNLQPLWSGDNWTKGAKLPDAQTP